MAPEMMYNLRSYTPPSPVLRQFLNDLRIYLHRSEVRWLMQFSSLDFLGRLERPRIFTTRRSYNRLHCRLCLNRVCQPAYFRSSNRISFLPLSKGRFRFRAFFDFAVKLDYRVFEFLRTYFYLFLQLGVQVLQMLLLFIVFPDQTGNARGSDSSGVDPEPPFRLSAWERNPRHRDEEPLPRRLSLRPPISLLPACPAIRLLVVSRTDKPSISGHSEIHKHNIWFLLPEYIEPDLAVFRLQNLIIVIT